MAEGDLLTFFFVSLVVFLLRTEDVEDDDVTVSVFAFALLVVDLSTFLGCGLPFSFFLEFAPFFLAFDFGVTVALSFSFLVVEMIRLR